MRRFAALGVVAAGLAALLLLQLRDEAEVAAWEILLALLLLVLLRVFPSKGRATSVPPLFGGDRQVDTHAPRSVASFELAAVHAFSESPGADRRLRVLMRRVAAHRLRRSGVRPGSARASELIDPVLFADDRAPLTGSQIERIVDQMEAI
jgi:hypothetical protein